MLPPVYSPCQSPSHIANRRAVSLGFWGGGSAPGFQGSPHPPGTPPACGVSRE